MDARKEKYGSEAALELARAARHVIVGRGKKWERFDMGKDPDEALLLKKALGPSGNLRAPTLKVGKDLLVGFCQEAWDDYFG